MLLEVRVVEKKVDKDRVLIYLVEGGFVLQFSDIVFVQFGGGIEFYYQYYKEKQSDDSNVQKFFNFGNIMMNNCSCLYRLNWLIFQYAWGKLGKFLFLLILIVDSIYWRNSQFFLRYWVLVYRLCISEWFYIYM